MPTTPAVPSVPPPDVVVPRRSTVAVWILLGAVAVAAGVFRLWGPRPGCVVLGVTLVALAVARLAGPEPGLPGVAVRSRVVDVTGYLALAAAILVLPWTLPSLA